MAGAVGVKVLSGKENTELCVLYYMNVLLGNIDVVRVNSCIRYETYAATDELS